MKNLVDFFTIPASAKGRSVLFLSGSSRSIGHIYRVEHAFRALAVHGWLCDVLPFEDPSMLSRAARADLVVVFRALWNKAFEALIETCQARNVPVVYDIDDLLFDEVLSANGGIAFLDDRPDDVKRHWVEKAGLYRKALAASSAAVLTTTPLADAATRCQPNIRVLPNALDDRMEARAEAALVIQKASSGNGYIRLLFASGTPSHQRDFAVIAEAVAGLMARSKKVFLRVLGYLNVHQYHALLPFLDRIELRPLVAFEQLFAEVATCDVNLCPLETNNIFCQAKSAVRSLVAAAVEVPTVASPTPPFQEAIVDGHTGFLANTTGEWIERISQLVREPDLRTTMGCSARIDALDRYGFKSWSRQAVPIYSGFVDDHRSRRVKNHEQ